MFVIGTAGHIDHGKSALIQALTGINPDRLREEQERGMTIELGFAWMTLPSGREVSIVDVPGHVRFVRHMLAGIGAVDLALLVIAADEGIMPQTREHLEILDLLDISRAIVVLTKCDLVEEEWVALIEEDVRKTLAGTNLEDAPLVRVSSTTGSGLDPLRAMIDEGLDAAPEPRNLRRPRLGIDRVFTMPGFGTVVTGTLLDGTLRAGDTVEVVPEGPTARIRGLQTHRSKVTEAQPGSRVAVNLAGVATADLLRGQVLAPPGRMPTVRSFNARVRALPDRPIRHNLRATLYTGAAEVQARVRVLSAPPAGETGALQPDRDEIHAGESGWVQLVLREPIAAVVGDLFVLRVSDRTVGGGRIIEVNPPRHRRTERGLIERLESHARGTPESRVLAALERSEPVTISTLGSSVEVAAATLPALIEALTASGDVHLLDAPPGEPMVISAGGFAQLSAIAEATLDAFHHTHPLRFAMPREELRAALRLPPREFAAVLGRIPSITAAENGVALAQWKPQPDSAQGRAIELAAQALHDGGLQPPHLTIDPEVLAYLIGAGLVIDCGEGRIFATEPYAAGCEAIVEFLRTHQQITLAEARDVLGTNRRTAQVILETLDRRGVTRFLGEARVLHESMRQAAAGPGEPTDADATASATYGA